MTSAESSLPQSFGHYDVERVLGRGAMGTVYLARDQRIGRRVALKTIALTADHFDDTTSPKEFYSRLQREAEVSGSLVHPNIVTLYEAGYEDDRISYLAMEYVEGQTLLALMQETSPSPIERETAIALIQDVLRGLVYAHERGIIHRDIKPANIIVTADSHAKIADFGIARPQNSSITAAGALMGTPNYMSPEQVQGQSLTSKADVFSAGVMLFEMLTAVRPFIAGDLTAILHNILRKEVPHASDINPTVPRNLGDIVAHMVAKDPKTRPTSEEALAQLHSLTVAAPPSLERPRPQRRPWWIAGAALAVLVLIVIATSVALTRKSSRPTIQISPAQLREFDEKRQALERAATAFQAERYQESLDRYNAYLQKYPESPAAIEGRDRAQEALARKQAPEPEPAKTAKTHKKHPKDEDISPSELLNRIKKIFKGH